MPDTPRRFAEDAHHPPPIGIGKLLRRSHLAFSKLLRDRLKDHDVSFSEFVHLERLWYDDGLNQTELSRRVGIETASSTTVLDALEKRGYIRRERDARDRRNVRVFLEPAGAEIEAKLLDCAAGINAIAREGLSKADIAEFFRIGAIIAGNLEAQSRGASRKAGSASPAASAKSQSSRRKRDAD
ncbi:MAG: MarR family transcriptional regulator [Pseudolabrys sp.]|uniref:MarR family winged helix-turn-helix transcriptional regulator n=1 Tax=Pseudorhodoplanes sp. TaxID=1934341 RepID=UPI002A6717E0|nr:MarR family transcriptional regulator [Pseudorhodoplanes sp.]MCW5687174.1 MarR family transcriptional regulator [Pseudolabrys sp.]HWV43537.1 MarR family transcriptional regulator [Pseudorhodoplanes sp.]